jgi:hypothetical protein
VYSSGAKQAAEKLHSEGGGGFNPRIKPAESTRASAPEEPILPISPENLPFSAACKARLDFRQLAARSARPGKRLNKLDSYHKEKLRGAA